MLNLASGANAQPGVGRQRLAALPGLRLALNQGPLANSERRQPVSGDIGRRHGLAAGEPRLRNLDGELQQLYDQIMSASVTPLSSMH